MSLSVIGSFALCWLACGVVAGGCVYAYFQRTYGFADAERVGDARLAWVFVVVGPFGLFLVVMNLAFVAGWQPPTRPW